MRMNLMRPVFAALVAASLFTFVGCCGSACGDAGSCCSQKQLSRAEQLRAKFDSEDRNYIFVVAHRSDWRHNPENSIPSILSAIEMGADMVEIDVAKTKDGHFVLSHDGKLDRVSDKKGKIKDLTLAEVREARLREGQGGKDAKLTDIRVPTLKEALEVCRGKILVNIDKFNQDPEGITSVISSMGIQKQVVLKGGGDFAYMKQKIGEPWKYIASRDFIYMPIVGSGKTPEEEQKTIAHVKAWDASEYPPPAYEVCVPGGVPKDLFDVIFKSPNRPRLWINTLWDSLAHEHSESLKGDAFTPETVWGWWIDRGATMIQTDDPAALLQYLQKIGRHTL